MFLVFLGINFAIYLLISLVIGLLLAKLLIAIAYYGFFRYLIRSVVFPGSNFIAQRKFEFNMAKNIAIEMLRNLESFKTQINRFLMTMKFNEKRMHNHGLKTLICDHQRSFDFISECNSLKQMIKTYCEQIDRIKGR